MPAHDTIASRQGQRIRWQSSGASSRLESLLRSRRWFHRAKHPGFWIVLAGVLFCGSLLWADRWLSRSFDEVIRRSMNGFLATNVNTIDLYFQELELASRRLVRDEEVRSKALRHLQAWSRFGDQSNEVSDGLLDVPTLASTAGPADVLGWVLVSVQGEVVVSQTEALRKRRFHFENQQLQRLMQAKSVMLFSEQRGPKGSFFQDVEKDEAAEVERRDAVGFLAVMATPVQDGDLVVGAMGWVLDPAGRASAVLEASQTGRSDQAFLFQRSGRVVTRSRFEQQLRLSGLLPPTRSSEGNVFMRAPIERADASTGESRTWVGARETLLAEQAASYGFGLLLDPYMDCRGEMVVGGWQWLTDFDIGIAVQMDYVEAFAPVLSLQRATRALLMLIGAAMSGVLLLTLLAGRWKRLRDSSARKMRQLGQYRLVELIGVGGMGSVYLGRHQLLRRDVAVKVLEGEKLSPQSIQRFQREVQLTATLRHPNTIAIFDFGHTHLSRRTSGDPNVADEDSVFYYVMEYVDGVSLQHLIDLYGPQSPARTIHLLLQICGSIGEAHRSGLIHRDIKPANVLLTCQAGLWDHIKVLDFGLVKNLDAGVDLMETVNSDVTQAGTMTGTPLYMAPECIRDAAAVSPQSDIYSIGAVGYALLTGHNTYEGESAIDLCLKQLEAPPMRPSARIGSPLPERLQDILMQCLRLRASERPASIATLTTMLEELPEASHWNQSLCNHWWENVFERKRDDVFEGSGNKTVVNAKAP
ncbi:MAG: serine/threonine-protein kinase [Planctomycetota bacterium]